MSITFLKAVVWNLWSLFWAFRSQPKNSGIKEWREWFLKNTTPFTALVKATVTKWDDRILDALIAVMNSDWLLETALDVAYEESAPILVSAIETERAGLLQRLRNRLRERGPEQRSIQSRINEEHGENAGSISVALMIISIIASSTNIFEFLRKIWKERRQLNGR